MLHLGFDATRLRKPRRSLRHRWSRRFCTNGVYQARKSASAPINCGVCDECVRTIIMLDHLGHLDAFQACFDLAHYQNNRAALVTRLSESSQALDREAVVLLAT